MDYTTFKILEKPYTYKGEAKQTTADDVRVAMSGYSALALGLQNLVGDRAPNQVKSIVQNLSSSANRHLNACLREGETVARSIPLLNASEIQDYIMRLQSLSRQETNNDESVVTWALAAYLFETRILWNLDTTLSPAGLTISNIVDLSSYSLWKLVDKYRDAPNFFGTSERESRWLREIESQIEKVSQLQSHSATNLSDVIKSVGDDLRTLEISSRQEIDATSKKVQGMAATLEQSRLDLERLLLSIDTTDANIKSFSAAIREELKTAATKKMWSNRGFWSAVSFWVSAACIAGAIVGPLFYTFTHVEDVVDVLSRVSNAAVKDIPADATAAQITASTIARLAVVTAPLALYVWAVKLLVRFNARSMMLMDDARQRHTTMDTYFHLVEKDVATKDERAHMLNALFRPLPGQPADNVEPPIFVDIINKKTS